jgi:hypothetical protein
MKTGSLVVAVSVVLVASFTLSVSDAFATDQIIPRIPSSRRIQERIVPGGFFKLPEARRVEFKHPVNRHRRFLKNGFGSGTTFVGVIAPPVSYTYDNDPGYYGPIYDDPGPAYAAPPAYYSAPVYGADYAPPVNTVSVAPPPPPMPSVVEYPNGRFELRGDGMTSPYNWVWIPNPPPPPPVAAPSGGPMFSPTADRPSFSSRRIYRWTDDQGVINVTDRLDSVPSKYRGAAAQTPPS